MFGLIYRYLVMALTLGTPGRWRGSLLARLGVLGAFGQGSLFCTTRIGTEPYLIHIGSHTVIASDVLFVNHDMAITVAGAYLGRGHLESYGEILIGSHCFIGARAILFPGVTICDGAIVGAGSMVLHDILEPGVYVGVGPKKISELESYVDKAAASFQERHASLVARYPTKFRMEPKGIHKLNA